MQLGPKKGAIAGTHFSYEEALRRSGYDRVPVSLWRGVVLHAKNLETLRRELNAARVRHGHKPTGLTVISWIRSPERNLQVGGASQSKHMQGIATDISREEIRRICPWKGGTEDFDYIASRVFSQGGFGTYPGGNRHVDSRGYRARWSSWVPGRKSGR